MLYADLHSKLAADAKDVERSEDLLTSNVFGTLVLTGAWGVLAGWLARARPHGSAPPLRPAVEGEGDCWFWPRLAEAEPDVLVRFGDLLVIVEAKYHSHKSGRVGPVDTLAADGSVPARDQLARQWRSCAVDAALPGCPPELAQAIGACPQRALVYLVKRGRRGRAWAELAESAKVMPAGAALYVLSWEDLDEILERQEQVRWVRDLRRYLAHRRLSTFRGVTNALAPRSTLALCGWHRRRTTAPAILTAFPRERLSLLAGFAARGAASLSRPAVWSTAVAPDRLPGLAALACRPGIFDAAR